MTLYEIDNEISALFEHAKEAYAESQNDNLEWIEKEFERLQITKEKKITNIIKYIKNLECLNDGIKKERESFYKRIKSNNNQIKSLEFYLGQIIGIGKKYENENGKITWRKSEIVEVYNQEELTEKYLNYNETWTPDKKTIKKDIKEGLDVKGAKLIEKNNIQIK